ncbi:MAG: hypothetical protein ACRBG0_21515 [Lewinella sp.]|uniref:hypothetical protein n=1 Tax=Lewinella sp. TaxID=2004506 RepID=UPI003D6A46F7
MKEQPITIKVSKEKTTNYQRNTTAFETLRYEEVGKSWLLNKKREVGEWLNNVHQTLTLTVQKLRVKWQVITGNSLVKKTLWLVSGCFVVGKDILVIIYYVVLSCLEVTCLFIGALLRPAPRNTTHTRPTRSKTKPFEPPIDDEWWRERPKPKPAKKTRKIRVIVEVEE